MYSPWALDLVACRDCFDGLVLNHRECLCFLFHLCFDFIECLCDFSQLCGKLLLQALDGVKLVLVAVHWWWHIRSWFTPDWGPRDVIIVLKGVAFRDWQLRHIVIGEDHVLIIGRVWNPLLDDLDGVHLFNGYLGRSRLILWLVSIWLVATRRQISTLLGVKYVSFLLSEVPGVFTLIVVPVVQFLLAADQRGVSGRSADNLLVMVILMELLLHHLVSDAHLFSLLLLHLPLLLSQLALALLFHLLFEDAPLFILLLDSPVCLLV